MTSNPHPADFIEVYHDALDAATCRAIVERFDASRQDQPGQVGTGVAHSSVPSTDRRSVVRRRLERYRSPTVPTGGVRMSGP